MNAVQELKAVYEDGGTFLDSKDLYTFLTMRGFVLRHTTAVRMDNEARNQMAHEGKQVQDPTWGNNWSRTMLATQEDMEKSRRRAVRYLKTFAGNLAAKLNVDANQREATAEAIANAALLDRVVEFVQYLSEYDVDV